MNCSIRMWNARQFRFLNRRGVIPSAVLTIAIVCSRAPSAAGQSAVPLQPLVNDTVAQLKLSYRHDVPEQRRRYHEIANALAAWRAADRMPENDRRLEEWLRGAIRSSMPGSTQQMPPLPTFAERPEPAPPAEPAPVSTPSEVEPLPVPPASAGELPLPRRSMPPAIPPATRSEAPRADPMQFESPTRQPVTVERPAIPPAAAADTSENAVTQQQPARDNPPATEPATGDELFAEQPTNERALPRPTLEDELPEEPALDEDPDILKSLSDPFVDDPMPF